MSEKLEQIVSPKGMPVGLPRLISVSHNSLDAKSSKEKIRTLAESLAPKQANYFLVGKKRFVMVHEQGKYEKPFVDKDSQPVIEQCVFYPIQFYV